MVSSRIDSAKNLEDTLRDVSRITSTFVHESGFVLSAFSTVSAVARCAQTHATASGHLEAAAFQLQTKQTCGCLGSSSTSTTLSNSATSRGTDGSSRASMGTKRALFPVHQKSWRNQSPQIAQTRLSAYAHACFASLLKQKLRFVCLFDLLSLRHRRQRARSPVSVLQVTRFFVSSFFA